MSKTTIKSGFFSFRSLAIVVATAVGVCAPAAAWANSKYAAIVIDARTGQTLYSSSADEARFPASLTKMMTLYLTFEALAAGKINKSSPVTYSAKAAAESPTKLGVRAGGSVSVETAILSLVTRSANDSATALGEMLAGSEQNFARAMTAKARSLGMAGTVFQNAHGLPNPAQKTTARDMAKLGIALREHFPQYYAYFSTRSFKYGKQTIPNHNRLLGRVKGVDGIKTGYTRASGFNLVSSVSEGNRRIVAVVMGGTSGAARDNQMADLIAAYLPKASTSGGGALIARSGAGTATAAIASVMLPHRNVPTPDSRPGSVEAVLAQAPMPVAPVRRPAKSVPTAEAVIQAYAAPVSEESVDPVSTGSIPTGWSVQVASSPSAAEAQALLDATNRQASAVLASAAGYTVPFVKDGVTYYRARFGGFSSKDAAWNACTALKKQKIACYATQQ
ncbi:SPOR domain-containing protein [Oryzicola mucosus]|uniref:D-alanyl-D-alanine carboxypeptidase n=1 Tax=Oryzicola mucosus TaxID=2767425 RepID=A0A8J6PXT3_9HYPH|nr:D-alanyl-D-alanine carboxypeptidase [Oryzicola mucosus]MBD0416318.1 D-alanyl-D-alanine carboxypeptidase [Oryzicola mucosus]